MLTDQSAGPSRRLLLGGGVLLLVGAGLVGAAVYFSGLLSRKPETPHVEPTGTSAAAPGPRDLLLGRWDLADPRGGLVTLEFCADGSVLSAQDNEVIKGTWKLVDDANLELTFRRSPQAEPEVQLARVQVSKDDLIATVKQGQEAHFKRSSEPSLNAGATPVPANGWKAVTSQNGAFTALFPGMPTQTIAKSPTDYHYEVTLKRGRSVFLVTYQDLPPETVDRGARAIYDDIVKQNSNSTKTKKDIDLAGKPGLELVGRSGRDGENSARFFLIKDRLYGVELFYPEDAAVPLEDRQKFLDSFRPVYDPAKAADLPPPPPPPPDLVPVNPGLKTFVEKLGGRAQRVPGSGKVVVSLSSNKKITEEDLKLLAGFTGFTELDLSFSTITDTGLKQLAGLRGLEKLRLQHVPITDAGLKDVATLADLRELNLMEDEVTGAGLKELAALKNLQKLELDVSRIGDADLKGLAALTSLQSLDLTATQITDVGLKELASLKSLHELRLDSTAVGGAGLKELAALDGLQVLSLGFMTKIADDDLKELAALKNLQSLKLFGTPLTDAGLNHLAALKNLKELDLTGTKATAAGVAELEKALPGCAIRRPQ